MPYQENSNNGQDVTPEEYLRRLVIQRRMIQSQGGITPRSCQGDATFPKNQQIMQTQMNIALPQKMMQSLQVMNHQAHDAGNQMYGGNGTYDVNRDVDHQWNLSRSFTGISRGEFPNNMTQATSSNMAPSRSSLSRSLDQRFDISGFDEGMTSTSLPNRISGSGPRKGGSSVYSSTRCDGGFYGHSMITQRLLGSDPPANLPTFDMFTSHQSVQGDNNTVDQTDDLAQASAGVLSPINDGKRRRLNSDELVREMLGEYAFVATKKDDIQSNDKSNDASICRSPFTRRTEVCCSPLTPLDQAQSRGFAETDSPLGQTPIMFAKFFLNAEGKDENGNVKIESGIPLPPLYQSKTGHRPNSSVRKFVFNDVNFDPDMSDQDPTPRTPFSSEPLCLPPRRKKKTTLKPKKRIVTKSNSGRYGTTKSPTKPPTKQKGEALESPARDHVITPSNAAIFALSTKTRNQMQSSPGSNNDSSSPPTLLDDSYRSNDEGFSIPGFATAMEASQLSQQNIQVGLHQAHSKTMRESALSRKNVLGFLKGNCSELLKSALAARLKQSTTSTAATSHAHSLSGSSFLAQEEEENKAQVQVKVDETANEGSEEDKSQDETQIEAMNGVFQIPAKGEHFDNERLNLKANASTSSPGLNTNDDDDNSMGFGSIGSFSHDDTAKFDMDDEELTNMFRRASLDYMPENLRRTSNFGIHRRSSTVTMTLEEPEYKQCFARSA